MAVEAQLCPQCGVAIQFGAGQTEAVCAYCGTAVVRPATPSAAAVEKERAAEQRVQATVAQETKLYATGVPALGKIVAAQTTDIFRQTLEGRAVLMVFALEVQPAAAPPLPSQRRRSSGSPPLTNTRPARGWRCGTTHKTIREWLW